MHTEEPDTDPWLERWLPLLQNALKAGPAVLELGCDAGRDTAWLARHGFDVIGTDIDAAALQACAERVPAARLLQHDLQTPLPFGDAAFGAIVASLCLHYFPWADTVAMAARIQACLRPGGLLLCRLNSTHDVHHGASGYREIEANFYEVNARYAATKRFFDEAAVRALFADGWEFISLEERSIDRYDAPKMVWEAILRRR